jgi:hypothetical protein
MHYAWLRDVGVDRSGRPGGRGVTSCRSGGQFRQELGLRKGDVVLKVAGSGVHSEEFRSGIQALPYGQYSASFGGPRWARVLCAFARRLISSENRIWEQDMSIWYNHVRVRVDLTAWSPIITELDVCRQSRAGH